MNSIIEWYTIAWGNKTVLDLIADMLIPILSVTCVFLATSRHNTWKLIGFVIGLCSQVVWFKLAINSYSLGALTTAVFFTVLWMYRLYGLCNVLQATKR